MSDLLVKHGEAFGPLLQPARYKGVHGGRGSGKSHFFAERLIVDSIKRPGLRSVCIREVQKTLAQSAKLLLEDKITKLGVAAQFDITRDEIRTPGGGLIIFQGMQDHTAESIKSLEGFDRAWIEEAQTLSTRSLTLLRPTIRAEGSEIWASWNPRRKTDAIDEFLRGQEPQGSIVLQANWKDNPWFPATLDAERRIDLGTYPDRYDHIWEGGYATALEGAYFAKQLQAAKAEGRIGHVAADPLLPIMSYHDIGGSGANADAYTIWVVQFVDREIRVLNYYESQGQTLAFHVNWMRENRYKSARVVLPHDGVNENNLTGKRYADHWDDAGFDVTTIPNQGRGAAVMRIEAARRLFPSVWFNADTTEAGRDALGFYHERKDEARNVGLGPEHDWSSHGADAFGLMCVAYEQPRKGNMTMTVPNFGAV